LIVIRTAPGSAQLVAGLLDKGKEIGILGTVAGDDTIFIAPIKTQQIKQVFQKVYALLLS
jgi:transcriptional regulator of arginine metabolism